MSSCLSCGRTDVNVTNVRGRDAFETGLIGLLEERGVDEPSGVRNLKFCNFLIFIIFVVVFQPLLCCVPCMRQVYNNQQPQLRSFSDLAASRLSNSSIISGYQSPDSSTSVPNFLSETPSSESLQPASSEDPELHVGSLPIRTSTGSLPIAAADSDILPPEDPKLLSQYNRIMARPGPKFLKRKLVQELENKDVRVEASQPSLDLQEQFMASLTRRIPQPKPKRQRQGNLSNNSSSASVGSEASVNSSRRPSAGDLLAKQLSKPRLSSQTQPSDPDGFPTTSSQSVMDRRPISQPLTTIAEIDVSVIHPRAIPSSSSLTSNDEPIFAAPAAKRPQVEARPAPKPDNPPAPRAWRKQLSPISSDSSSDDGNAHSNSGAPRRIRTDQIKTPNRRDPRPQNAKLITGG